MSNSSCEQFARVLGHRASRTSARLAMAARKMAASASAAAMIAASSSGVVTVVGVGGVFSVVVSVAMHACMASATTTTTKWKNNFMCACVCVCVCVCVTALLAELSGSLRFFHRNGKNCMHACVWTQCVLHYFPVSGLFLNGVTLSLISIKDPQNKMPGTEKGHKSKTSTPHPTILHAMGP